MTRGVQAPGGEGGTLDIHYLVFGVRVPEGVREREGKGGEEMHREGNESAYNCERGDNLCKKLKNVG